MPTSQWHWKRARSASDGSERQKVKMFLVIGVEAPHQNVLEGTQTLCCAWKRDGVALHHRFQFSIFGKCPLHQERAIAVLGKNIGLYGFSGREHGARA